jgi:hypothetical protein
MQREHPPKAQQVTGLMSNNIIRLCHTSGSH